MTDFRWSRIDVILGGVARLCKHSRCHLRNRNRQRQSSAFECSCSSSFSESGVSYGCHRCHRPMNRSGIQAIRDCAGQTAAPPQPNSNSKQSNAENAPMLDRFNTGQLFEIRLSAAAAATRHWLPKAADSAPRHFLWVRPWHRA